MTQVQSVVFRKPPWNYGQASNWLKEHGYSNTKDVDEKLLSLRFRQIDPSKFSRFYSQKLSNGVILVIGT